MEAPVQFLTKANIQTNNSYLYKLITKYIVKFIYITLLYLMASFPQIYKAIFNGVFYDDHSKDMQ